MRNNNSGKNTYDDLNMPSKFRDSKSDSKNQDDLKKDLLKNICRNLHYNTVLEYIARRLQQNIYIFYMRYKFRKRIRHRSDLVIDFVAALKIQQYLVRKFHANDATIYELLEEVLVLLTSTKLVSVMKNNMNNKGD
ncbi:hypothetical protein RF11_16412 [Thelohanellus kitauei]|uniref:Uncharacterized protein n=1 Tax=Thelohanellus kitauei TaxID=669202 RepID=A0A0C2M9C9_THEKT|nr:hypothetical protein RF11_16412 [Thelohanellus kitauei]